VSARAAGGRLSQLTARGLIGALDAVRVGVVILDTRGIVIWQNVEARQNGLGDAGGRDFATRVSPEEAAFVRGQLRAVFGGLVDQAGVSVTVLANAGESRRVKVSLAPIVEDERIVGAIALCFGSTAETLAPEQLPARAPPGSPTNTALTPRQLEVLRLLADGRSTNEIAASLGIARETVRNHVTAILKGLDVHSRIAAVTAARRGGLL
jgi:DNA-binding CsgD family transcriptional regulator